MRKKRKPEVEMNMRMRMKTESKSLLGAVLVVTWGILLVTAIPLQNTDISETASTYLERCLQDTGSLNVVTAILADYRLYDTLGEATVLFAAILGVSMLLGKSRHKTDEKIKQVHHLYGGSSYGDVDYR